MSANVRHSSEQPKWGTSLSIIEVAHDVLDPFGDLAPHPISLDPFSEPEFNEHVGALRILTGEKGLDGFKDRWLEHESCPRADHILAGMPQRLVTMDDPSAFNLWETALVNPPGDDSGDNIKKAWRLLDEYHWLGWLRGGAIWVSFNMNQMQTLQGESRRHPLSHDFEGLRCVPDKRQPFVRHSSTPTQRLDKKTGKLVDVSDAPSHPCFFLLLPSLNPKTAAEQRRRFESSAGKLGAVF